MVNFLIVHFNTQLLTECLLRSIQKYTPKCHVYIFDNSDKTPFVNTLEMDNITVFDNTNGQFVNFDLWLRHYPNRFYSNGKVNNWGSAKHCYSIEKCMDLINDNFILLDSDVLLKQDLTPLFDDRYYFIGEVFKQNYVDIYRVLPFVCFINVKKCKEHGIHYFNSKRMHGLYETIESDQYDTGANFYIETQKYSHKLINTDDYVKHYKGGSWDGGTEADKKARGFISEQTWLSTNRGYWSFNTDGFSVIVCATDKKKVNTIKENINTVSKCNIEYLIYYNTDGCSIAKVYNKMAKIAKYENLLFVHQDVIFYGDGWDIIREKLSDPNCGVIGFAGSKLVINEPSGWGIMSKYNVSNYHQCVYDRYYYTYNKKPFEQVIVEDGLAMFVNKTNYLLNPINENDIIGFHAYDYDLTLMIHLNGLKNYVYTGSNISVLHESEGNYNLPWVKTILYLNKYKWYKYKVLTCNGVSVDKEEEFKLRKILRDRFLTKINKLPKEDKIEGLKTYQDMIDKKVIFTCITDNYDTLLEPAFINSNFDYICFTDNLNLKSKVWKFREIPEELKELDKIKQQRCIKICPHKYLAEYDESIWVDGNILIKNDMNSFINKECENAIVAIPKHPYRSCIYEEIKACVAFGKEKKELADKLSKIYKAKNYPQQNGLYQTNIIYRKHTDFECIKLMDKWCDELIQYSHRDQLSLNFSIWEIGCQVVKGLSRTTEYSKYFNKVDHKHFKQENKRKKFNPNDKILSTEDEEALMQIKGFRPSFNKANMFIKKKRNVR